MILVGEQNDYYFVRVLLSVMASFVQRAPSGRLDTIADTFYRITSNLYQIVKSVAERHDVSVKDVMERVIPRRRKHSNQTTILQSLCNMMGKFNRTKNPRVFLQEKTTALKKKLGQLFSNDSSQKKPPTATSTATATVIANVNESDTARPSRKRRRYALWSTSGFVSSKRAARNIASLRPDASPTASPSAMPSENHPNEAEALVTRTGDENSWDRDEVYISNEFSSGQKAGKRAKVICSSSSSSSTTQVPN